MVNKKRGTKTANFVLMSVGTTFSAMVISGFLVGYFIDEIFNTRPWLMIASGFLGIVGGFIRIHEILNKMSQNDEK